MDIPSNIPSAPAMVDKRAQSASSDKATIQRVSNEASARAKDDPLAGPSVQTQDLSRPELKQVVETLNARTQVVHRNLQFAVDDSTGRTVITMSDSQTGEVIRQIPSEAVLRLAERLAGEESDSSTVERESPLGRSAYRPDAELGVGALLETEF